jgi:hypothetical protein
MGAKMHNPCPYPRDYTNKPNASPAPPPYVIRESTPLEMLVSRVENIESALLAIRDELQKLRRGE